MTVSGQEKDSIKYSINESKALVDSWLNLPRYVRLVDSCEEQIKGYKVIIKNDTTALSSCEKIKIDQNTLIEKHEEYKKNKESEIKKLDLWRRFWKTTSGILTLPAVVGVYSIYKEVKN